MKQSLSKCVRRVFAELISNRLPRFEMTPNPWDDADLYSWAMPQGPKCYLYLIFFPGKDRFNLEVAWSKKGNFPYHLIGRTLRDGPVNGEMRFRISDLWENDLRKDVWWSLRPEPTLEELGNAMAAKKNIPIQRIEDEKDAIECLTKDAVEKVCSHVVPYLESELGSNTG